MLFVRCSIFQARRQVIFSQMVAFSDPIVLDGVRGKITYRQTYNMISNATNPNTSMLLVSSCSRLCPIHWSQALSRKWRCSWSSADGRCSNYIWVINTFIAYCGATYIRGLTVHVETHGEANNRARLAYTMTSWHGDAYALLSVCEVVTIGFPPKKARNSYLWTFYVYSKRVTA